MAHTWPYAGAFAAVVTWAVMVQVPGVASEPWGMVPPVKVTVRMGVPVRETLSRGKKVEQVVLGGPVKRRLLLGVVGRVSDKLAPVNGFGDGL